MSAQSESPKRRHLNLAKRTGNPVYFFDTTVLLENVVSLAGWNQPRLEATIAPRVDRELESADIRIATDDGFYIVFANRAGGVARSKAETIRYDLLKHFYGPNEFPDDVADSCVACATSAASGVSA